MIEAVVAVESVLFALSQAVLRVLTALGDSLKSQWNFFWNLSAK